MDGLGLAVPLTTVLTVFIIMALVDLALKGWALWYAAKKSQTVWFVCLLIFSTWGVLPAIYLFFNVWNKK
jgi:hypothetical protein